MDEAGDGEPAEPPTLVLDDGLRRLEALAHEGIRSETIPTPSFRYPA